MFEALLRLLNGETPEEYVSPADIAEDVNTIHESLDLLKAWSLDTIEWLAEEQQRLENEGNADYVEELDDLMLYAQTVFLRIEYGDVSIRPEEGEEEAA